MQLKNKHDDERAYLFEEWQRLEGAVVRVCRDGKPVRTGVIDDVTPDGSIVWIAQEGVLGRSLFHKAEGYELWIAPKQLQVPTATTPEEVINGTCPAVSKNPENK